jgi:ankyrin repeat protein
MNLHTCCTEGNLHNFKQLMNNNLNINEKNDEGYTPLHLAVMNGHDALVMELIKYHANILDEDKYGRTALALGAERDNKMIVEELIKNIDIKDGENTIKVLMQLVH